MGNTTLIPIHKKEEQVNVKTIYKFLAHTSYIHKNRGGVNLENSLEKNKQSYIGRKAALIKKKMKPHSH